MSPYGSWSASPADPDASASGVGILVSAGSSLSTTTVPAFWPSNFSSQTGQPVARFTFAIALCPQARRFYERKKARRLPVVAMKALAHKLARVNLMMAGIVGGKQGQA